MKNILLPLFAAGVLFAASSAQADVFSSQNFSGDTATADDLPGVNLDAAPGFGVNGGNCEVVDVPAYSARDTFESRKGTTCKFGNFSMTTTGSNGNHLYDMTYGGNPPPWVQSWRP
jgi:hypothetical protein